MTTRVFLETNSSPALSVMQTVGGEYHTSRLDSVTLFGIVELDIAQTAAVNALTTVTLLPVTGLVNDATSGSGATKAAHLAVLATNGVAGTATTDQALSTIYVVTGNPFFLFEVSSASTSVAGVSGSIDGEIMLFSGTTGKAAKRATGSGLVTATSGVYSAIQASGPSKLLGRGSLAGGGSFEEITLGSGLSMNGTVLTASVSGSVSGSSGSPWTLVFNEDGTSLANWTSLAGSWSVSGSVLQAICAANNSSQLKYTAKVPQSAIIYEAQIKLTSIGGFGTDNRVGIRFSCDGVNASLTGFFVSIRSTGALTPASTGKIYWEMPANTTAGPTFVFLFNLDQFYTLRAVAVGNVVDFYVDGVFQTSGIRTLTVTNLALEYSSVTLSCFNCIAHYKNIKLYSMSVSLPA